MQLIIFLQISEYNYDSMYFLGIDYEVPYLVSIKIYVGNDIDKGNYVCDVLDYNKGTWWNFGDDTMTKYPGYPMNVYDDLSIDKNRYKN